MMLHRRDSTRPESAYESREWAKAIRLDEWLNMPPREPVRKAMVQSGTRNIYPYMIGSVKSYLANSDVDRIFLLIEDDEMNQPLPDCITCINVKDQKFFPDGGPNMRSKFTYMALLRSTLCHLFPEYDRIVCVDFDTIAVRDVSGLWDLPLGEDKYYSASREPALSRKTGLYYTNIGVCLYNLKKLRDGKADEIIQELNTTAYEFVEQDVLIRRCQHHIQPMDSSWNSCPYVDPPAEEVRIEHYAGAKRWETRGNMNRYLNTSWDDVMAMHEKHVRK